MSRSEAWQAVAGTVTAMRAEGKAIGVVASRDIDAGECVLQEPPLLTLTPDGAGRYDGRYNGREPEQAKALLATLSAARPGAGMPPRGDATRLPAQERGYAPSPRTLRACRVPRLDGRAGEAQGGSRPKLNQAGSTCHAPHHILFR